MGTLIGRGRDAGAPSSEESPSEVKAVLCKPERGFSPETLILGFLASRTVRKLISAV